MSREDTHLCTACGRRLAPGQSAVVMECAVPGYELEGYAHAACAVTYITWASAEAREQGQGREAAQRTLDAAIPEPPL